MSQFSDALRKGKGGAMLMLRADPESKDFHAALFSACVKNLSYDRQCEDSRAPWLLGLIEAAGCADDFFQPLVAALQKCDRESEHYDRLQIYELLCLLAAKNPRHDRSVLRDFLSSRAIGGDWVWDGCANEFIKLSGFEGLTLCASLFAADLADNFENWGGWAFQQWIETLKERDGVEETANALAKARPGNPALDDFMRRDAARMEAEKKQKAATSLPDYAMLKACGKGFPLQWIRQAPDAEIAQAAADLFEARATTSICNYLMIFGRRDFPLPPERLFDFLTSAERRPAYLAARALGRLKHSSIRAYGLDLLDRGKVALGLKLLRNNIAAGDFAKIEARLAETQDEDDIWHDIGQSLSDIVAAGQADPKEYAASLVTLYHKGPCALCRTKVVRALRDAGCAPDWMVQECAFDCDEDTRALFDASI